MAASTNGGLLFCEKRPTEPKQLTAIPTLVKAIPQLIRVQNECELVR